MAEEIEVSWITALSTGPTRVVLGEATKDIEFDIEIGLQPPAFKRLLESVSVLERIWRQLHINSWFAALQCCDLNHGKFTARPEAGEWHGRGPDRNRTRELDLLAVIAKVAVIQPVNTIPGVEILAGDALDVFFFVFVLDFADDAMAVRDAGRAEVGDDVANSVCVGDLFLLSDGCDAVLVGESAFGDVLHHSMGR